MMDILYVRKQERGPFLKRNLRLLRDSFNWHAREAFFFASLKTKTRVTRAGLQTIRRWSKSDFSKFDVIIFNYECNFGRMGEPIRTACEAVEELREKISEFPAVLLISSPNAKSVPSDEEMGLFELVFRREHFKDLDRYDLNASNKEKLRTTVLSCPLIPANILNFNRLNASDYGFDNPPSQFKYEVSFLGQETSKTFMRTEIVKHVRESGLHFAGGIHTDVRNPDRKIPEALYSKRLSQKEFYEMTRSSIVNLALEGYGQFTYRHWECWALSSFMISSPSVNEVKLPFEAVDGTHYVTFRDSDDLVEKVKYYMEHEDEREEIVKNGRQLFKEEYNFHKHGEFIVKQLKGIL